MIALFADRHKRIILTVILRVAANAFTREWVLFI